MSSNRKVSPLTGLPGNIQIQVELRKRLLKKEKSQANLRPSVLEAGLEPAQAFLPKGF